MTKDEMLVHLPLIQGVINRMGSNSFLVKGWTVTLVAAIFALAAAGTNPKFILIALVPTIAFWFLDSYYLKQEKLYRELYNAVISDPSKIDAFTMETNNYKTKNIFLLMFTISTGPFYFLLLIILVSVALENNGFITLDMVKNLCATK